jgi:hypothetical protein
MTSLDTDFSWFSRPVDDCAALALKREGRRWRLRFGQQTTLVDHSVGMLHLAVLTANPSRQISALDLVAGMAALTRPVTAAAPQPVLDGAAVRGYQRRLTLLSAEIDRASARADHRAVERMQAERTWILSELAGATGLGGRTRGFPDEAERARIAVGKAIRRAIDRITVADRMIGEHLRTAVHTGVRCCYQPSR